MLYSKHTHSNHSNLFPRKEKHLKYSSTHICCQYENTWSAVCTTTYTRMYALLHEQICMALHFRRHHTFYFIERVPSVINIALFRRVIKLGKALRVCEYHNECFEWEKRTTSLGDNNWIIEWLAKQFKQITQPNNINSLIIILHNNYYITTTNQPNNQQTNKTWPTSISPSSF
jgi:hypothetical protein